MGAEAAPYCFHTGTEYILEKDHEKAEKYLRKAIELKPEYGDAHYNLAECLRLQGNIEEAADHFKEAMELDPRLEEKFMKKLNLQEEVKTYEKTIQRRTFENFL